MFFVVMVIAAEILFECDRAIEIILHDLADLPGSAADDPNSGIIQCIDRAGTDAAAYKDFRLYIF